MNTSFVGIDKKYNYQPLLIFSPLYEDKPIWTDVLHVQAMLKDVQGKLEDVDCSG